MAASTSRPSAAASCGTTWTYDLRVHACVSIIGERLGTALQYGNARLRVLSLHDDPGATASCTGPRMLGSGSYHIRTNQPTWGMGTATSIPLPRPSCRTEDSMAAALEEDTMDTTGGTVNARLYKKVVVRRQADRYRHADATTPHGGQHGRSTTEQVGVISGGAMMQVEVTEPCTTGVSGALPQQG